MKTIAAVLAAGALSLGSTFVQAQNDQVNSPGQPTEEIIIIQAAPMEGEDPQMNAKDQAMGSNDQAPATAENCMGCEAEDGLGASDDDQSDDAIDDSDDDDGDKDNG